MSASKPKYAGFWSNVLGTIYAVIAYWSYRDDPALGLAEAVFFITSSILYSRWQPRSDSEAA